MFPTALNPLSHELLPTMLQNLMQTMEPKIQLLNEVSGLNEHFIGLVSAWLHDGEIVRLGHQHWECVKRREVDMGFNLFHLISDVYYRENLHSDIIQAIIDPAGSHGHGDHFLRLFLKYLREHHGVAIEIANYSNTRVFREAGRIDLLICDEDSKKAIIIENKINGAADMDRQLVRYLEKVKNLGYACDAIVYLCLNQKKHPETPGWTKREREDVHVLLKVICAYDESEGDLYHGWLLPCCQTSTSDEVTHVLRQYQQLILKLGRNLMNKPIMEKFYGLMRDKQHHDSALALTAMMNDLGAYRAERLFEAFQHDTTPFERMFIWVPGFVVFESVGGVRIKLDVDCRSQAHTTIVFKNQDDPESPLPKQILTEISMSADFKLNQSTGSLTRVFLFPSMEDELDQFIRDFKEALKKRTHNAA